MQHRIVKSLSVVPIILLLSVLAFGHQGGLGRGAPATGPPHDSHDLSGIWLGRAAGALNNPPPSFTPAGKAANPTTLNGIVTEFVWSNPHCQLYFDVKDANGKVTNWAGELNSPSVLGREGWTKRQFKPGEQITITLFPSKAGTPVGVVDRTHGILANGKERVPAAQRNVD